MKRAAKRDIKPRMTAAEYRQIVANTKLSKGNKYGNVRTEYQGVKYHSKAEASYAATLDLLVKAGKVRDIRRQVHYRLPTKKDKKRVYIADFVFFDIEQNKERVIDVKGFETGMFKLKKDICEKEHGIEIECVKVK